MLIRHGACPFPEYSTRWFLPEHRDFFAERGLVHGGQQKMPPLPKKDRAIILESIASHETLQRRCAEAIRQLGIDYEKENGLPMHIKQYIREIK